ncbi:recombinase family protein [bacterium]|nr:recombinase family protein [bacterium]
MVKNLAVAYARVSSKEQEREGYSIDAQLKLLRDYAHDQGLHIVRELQEAESAKGTGRKVFNSMLEYLKANPNVKFLLCEKTDRLSRNFKDIATLDQLMNEQGLTILLVKENAELSKESKSHEKFMFGIRALMAKNYVDNLSEEVKKGMQEKASQGKYPGGNIPYGYILDKNTGEVLPDPLRSNHIREIFELYAENKMSLRALAAWARSCGLTTPRSAKPITMCQIERILKNPFYYGVFRWAGKLYPGIHEPIISQELFEQTRRAFKLHNKPQLNRRQFAFGNLLICGRCGAKITAEVKKSKYVYYHCTGMKACGCDLVYVREAEIVEQFQGMLGPLVLTHDQATKILNHLSKRQGSSKRRVEAERQRIQQRLGQIDNWIRKAYEDKLEGTITAEHWRDLSNRWETERIQLLSQLKVLDADSPNAIATAERVLELSQKLPDLWLSRNNYEKRELVELIYSNCTLDGATLSAAYKKPFSIIAEGTRTKKWRPQYHSPQTFVVFEFQVKTSYSTTSGTRWKTIE